MRKGCPVLSMAFFTGPCLFNLDTTYFRQEKPPSLTTIGRNPLSPREEPTDKYPMTRYPPPPDNATTPTLLHVELPTGDGRQGSCSDAWPNSEGNSPEGSSLIRRAPTDVWLGGGASP
uniref:Uncharacterized protein n=1 Tax=Trichuris muris TaxID=70415 RepID=A0A5S6QFR2_TRIMR